MAKYEAPSLTQTWTEVRPGGVVTEHGNSVAYNTGTWRSMRPVWDGSQCRQCLMCWIMCPDAAVLIEDGKVAGYDYDHCKGCGVCAAQCPANIKEPHAITGEMGKVIQMVPESDFQD